MTASSRRLSPLSVLPAAATDESNRILVVDDDFSLRTLEATILQRAGHHVDTADDGDAAWRALLEGKYDLLVTDYMMPRLSGLDLVRQLRKAQMALPVVMVSGTFDLLDPQSLIGDPWARIHAFVHKPFTVPTLLAAVQNALNPHQGFGGSHSAA